MPISNSIDHLFEINTKGGSASVNILDESVLNGEAKSCKILCTIDVSFIGISVLDSREMKFVGLETFHFSKPASEDQLSKNILSLADQSSILKKVKFNKASVQFSNSLYTLVPSVLFRKEEAEKYFFFNHPKKTPSKIEQEQIKSFDTVNIFSVSEQVYSSLKKVFENFSLHHHVTSVLDAIRLHHEKHSGKTIHINFRSSWLDVIVTEGKKLILCNSFNFKSVEDAVYYVLLVCEQLSLNPQSVEVEMMGEIEKESAINNLMQKYIAHVHFSERIKALQFSYGFDAVPSHFYYSVFSHALCES